MNAATRSLLAAATLLFGVSVVTGCRDLPPSKPLQQLTPQELAGYRVFASRCAECHHPNTQRALHGPGLQGIFKEPYLPSGQPANDERVRALLIHGRGNMPSFANLLDDQQTTDLLAYLHTL